MIVPMATDKTNDPTPVWRNAQHWAIIAGRWEYDGASAKYVAPNAPDAQIPYGLALADILLQDGAVEAQLTLPEQKDTTAGIILGYQSQQAPYVMAQIGAYGSEYAISVNEPGFGWRGLYVAGSDQNIRINTPYSVRFHRRGARLTFDVNSIRIFDHVLPQPMPGTQVGVYAWGKGGITFDNVRATTSRPRAFVAMPFSEPFNTLYDHVIRPVSIDGGFDPVRIDDISRPGIIFEDIQREIAIATVVVAEITAANQNVFYELGYAHGFHKPTILLAQRNSELPFDIRSYRVIFYDDTIGGRPNVENELRAHLRSVLDDSSL